MLTDSADAAFTLVTIPEAMAVEESLRYLSALREARVPVTDLVINRVEREHADCSFCRARARSQAPWLKRLATEFRGLRVRRVPVFPAEVRGTNALRRFARAVWFGADPNWPTAAGTASAQLRGAKTRVARATKGATGQAPKAAPVRAPKVAQSSSAAASERFATDGRRLLVFGGKGGVGKTTAAAATALALARADASRRILVFSIDPAHSLSDSFAEEIGELKRGVAGQLNLDAKEIDPAAKFEELKERYRQWADELFEMLAGGSRWEVKFDREAMRELVALAPPGMDEIAALSAVSDLLDEGVYTTIVLDTAPTGHLLRFIELPGVALAWVRTFLKLLLKYRNVVRWEGVAAELVALSKSIKRVAELLIDERATEFVGVAAPERMSLEETVRLAASLERLRVPLRTLLINNVIPIEAAALCDFCAARRRAQLGVVKEFQSRLIGPIELHLAPQRPAEVRGPELLQAHFAGWHSLG
jgi:arsenite/tail-anchored protein-transporting ATPase